MAASVVIVSNRLPISVKMVEGRLEYYPSVGGLATGLADYVNDKRNKWIGWPGIPSDGLTKAGRDEIARELHKHNCYPVFLTQKQLDEFYNGYSNSILWPLFHDLPVRKEVMADHDTYWRAYRKVNSAFAGVVLALSDQGSTIWVHDYQLLALPAMLRAVRPKAKIGFFLHIPFPGLKFFRQIPSARQLLLGVLGADLIGMHTKSYTQKFIGACSQLTREIVAAGQVMLGTHVTRVLDFPMGIDYDRFTQARSLDSVKRALRRHQRKYRGLKVILTVDRLDPTKGLVERLEAYQEFLRKSPRTRGQVVLVMLAVPSRTEIDEYKQLRERVEQLVDDITKEFGTPAWQPVDYMYTTLPVESVTALYQVADVAFITPLRDGMNLVAKEYIASRPNNDGVLILSSTAGAAQELGDALLVNPRRRDSLVNALTSAVRMPKRELKRRITTMNEHISTHTVQHWAGSFMKSLQKPLPGTPSLTRTLTADRIREIREKFKAAKHPVLLLDYDGVLAPHVADPAKALPTAELKKILARLGRREHAEVAIISGRGRGDLDNWLGQLPISLVAEHGALFKQQGRKRWSSLSGGPADWQHVIRPILERYAALTPGAFVETKEFSLVWHYRSAAPYAAQKNLVILRKILPRYTRRRGLGIYTGSKILEIKPENFNKGSGARELLGRLRATNPKTPPDFILCIGDDYTDEDMFESLPDSAVTIKLGRGPTAARYRIKSVSEVIALLRILSRILSR